VIRAETMTRPYSDDLRRKRKLIEKVFGWSKLGRPLHHVKLRGLDRVDWFYRLTLEAGKTAHRDKTKTENRRQNRLRAPKISAGWKTGRKTRTFSAACLAPEGCVFRN
jgi:hypothetical protein